MKILLISDYLYGYMDVAADEMKRQGHQVEALYFDKKPLQLDKNNLLYAKSGLGKILGKNAKFNARYKVLKKVLHGKKFDFTLIVRPQRLNAQCHEFLKSISGKYTAFLIDGLSQVPEQKNITSYFNQVFSYDPGDCEKESYTFLSKFIPSEDHKKEGRLCDFQALNVCSNDERLPILKKLAIKFLESNIQFKFILFSKTSNKKLKLDFEIYKNKEDFDKLENYIKRSKVIIDIQKSGVKGLSFRAFEALGNDKKFITNNPEIINYPFYNPENIWVMNEGSLRTPMSLFTEPYQAVPQHIYAEYTVESWVKKVLG